MDHLNERAWIEVLEQGIVSYLTWPKRNEHGHYGERFKGFSNLMKCTQVFVFSDNVMQQLAPSPLFTDGVHVYLHESLANECWQVGQEKEFEGFRPIWHGVMRSVEWAAKPEKQDLQSEQAWKYVEFIPLDVWVDKLKKAKASMWLDRLGFSLKTTAQDIQSTIQARRDVVQWVLAEQQDQSDPQTNATKPASKLPVWLNEADRVMRSRWDDCIWHWDEKVPLTYQRWTLHWVLAERMGRLIGEARNAMQLTGSENKVIKEGWGSAMSGWTQTLKAMLIQGDWISFGRSILAFIQACHEHETLTFDEKTDITGVAAQVLEEMAFKMAWVDLLSGSYEFWSLNKVLKEDVGRFWNTHQKPQGGASEALAFYTLLPDSPPQVAFKKDYLLMFFQGMLEQIDGEQPQEHMLREGFDMLLTVVRGVDSDDALVLVEKWREWAEDQAPEWFDDHEEFEDEGVKFKEHIEKMVEELLKSRRWKSNHRRQIEQVLLF
jgi:hypothetical protein